MPMSGARQHLAGDIQHFILGSERSLHDRLVRLQYLVEEDGQRVRGMRAMRPVRVRLCFARHGAGVEQHAHDAYACNTVSQAVMYAEDNAGPIFLETANQGNVPQWVVAVEMRADNFCGFSLETYVRALFHHDFAHMVTNVEIGIGLPLW